jgi:hypothetical protein
VKSQSIANLPTGSAYLYISIYIYRLLDLEGEVHEALPVSRKSNMKSAPKCGCLLVQQRLEIMEKACRHVCPFVFDRQLMIMRSILTEKECLKKR